MSILIALDPSLTRCGLALFVGGTLMETRDVPMKKEPGLTRAQRSLEMVYMCHAAITTWLCAYGDHMEIHDLACEWPQIYTREKSKGDNNGLLPLASVCTGLALMMQIGLPYFHAYKPGEWAGKIPKNETVKGCKSSPRAKKTIKCLDPSEMVVWNRQVKYHDEIDAIGIGLFHLGRFNGRKVRPGATKG